MMANTGVSDNRLIKASALLNKPARKTPSPWWAVVASTLMAGAACGLVWAMLLGPQADMTAYQAQVPEAIPEKVMAASEGR